MFSVPTALIRQDIFAGEHPYITNQTRPALSICTVSSYPYIYTLKKQLQSNTCTAAAMHCTHKRDSRARARNLNIMRNFN